MKNNKKLFLAIIILLFGYQVHAEIRLKSNKLILENEFVKKEIQVSIGKAGDIHVSSIFSKEQQKELLSTHSDLPFFEFVINKKLVSALDKFWQYKSHHIRKMENGGEEVTLILKGVKAPVKDLEIIIYQQLFPGTTLIREKLVLQAPDDKVFPLNKLKDKLHFKFPQYSLDANTPLQTTEIRIASWAQELIEYDTNATYDDRKFARGKDSNLANCHMYHPKLNIFNLEKDQKLTVKGPLNILSGADLSWIFAYEHASPDQYEVPTPVSQSKVAPVSRFTTDGQQGVEGTFNLEEKNQDVPFIGISQILTKAQLDVSVDILKGGYLEGETITLKHPYETVWTASAFYHQGGLDKGKEIIRDYLFNHICEHPASRKPSFYYNTWGMQRDLSMEGKPLRGVFTEERIKQEIRYAAQLGVDLFVLDDGWEQTQGDWTPNKERLKNGLKPLKEELDKYNMTMGIWLSPMGIDKETERYKQHPEWVIKDSNGEPIKAQWNHPAFDFVSDFYDVFVADCKRLIDQGARFFKWDAINTFNSTLPNLHHGSDKYSDLEIKQRYDYLLPIYVTRAMQELTNYEPDLVIEMDLTEARRVMVGLAPLSQGKLFWMNNGASGYGDYSTYRTKSMRTITNQFAGLIPLELFTFATYPHNASPFYAQRYNVNTSLIAGHGFWGNLDRMKEEDRLRVGQLVNKAKRVLPYITMTEPHVFGKVGASPEIYSIINQEKSAGQVIAFSGQAMQFKHRVTVNSDNFLAVLNHAYILDGDSLDFKFEFTMPDDTREAFILTNEGKGISIVSSTSWLDNIELSQNKQLEYVAGAPGIQVIYWQKNLGKPEVKAPSSAVIDIKEKSENRFEIKVDVKQAGDKITVQSF